MTDFRDEISSGGGGPSLIHKRNGGCAVVVGNKLYVWGGQEDYDVS